MGKDHFNSGGDLNSGLSRLVFMFSMEEAKPLLMLAAIVKCRPDPNLYIESSTEYYTSVDP